MTHCNKTQVGQGVAHNMSNDFYYLRVDHCY